MEVNFKYPGVLLLGTLLLFSSCSKKGNTKTGTDGNNDPVVVQPLTVITLAGSGAIGSADGIGIFSTLNSPSTLAVNSAGELIVGDWANNLIRKIDLGTHAVTTIAGKVTPGFVNGPVANATFYGTANITFDSSGDLYIADEENNAIREINTAGTVTTVAGSGVDGYKDGVAASAAFSHPEGLVTDNKGNLFVADGNNNVIRKIVLATGVVSTYAGNGAAAFKDGALADASFHSPYGLTIDAAGNLYVADIVNNRIRKITISTGIVSTFAGNGTKGLVNGTALAASFFFPGGVTFDSKGNLFVSELRNNTIRKIATDGTVTTYAGTGAQGTTDGAALSATFYQPLGIAFDKSDNLYVADEYNNKIRKISVSQQQ